MFKRLLNILLVTVPLSTHAASADNGRLDLSYGLFSFNAKSGEEKTNISSPSAFALAYIRPVSSHFDLVGGYSLLMADLSGSDIGYGFNLGANYRFFSGPMREKYSLKGLSIVSQQEWIPFVGFGFYQRNFQSAKNTFAGFGFSGGTEKRLTDTLNLKVEARFIQLNGAAQSSATEMDLLFGLVVKFN
jgi:opacity protein-like surface antigen